MSKVTIRLLADYPGYAVSKDGRVWSNKGGSWKQMKATVDDDGYLNLHLGKLNRKVHRLVWEGYKGRISDGLEINHCDSVKAHCCLFNLELVTHAQNMKHAWENGLIRNLPRGVLHHKARLSEQDVRDIRKMSYGGVSQRKLAKLYQTPPSNIFDIVHRNTWKHI